MYFRTVEIVLSITSSNMLKVANAAMDMGMYR